MFSVVLVFVAVLIYNYNVSKNALLIDVENDAAILANSILYNIEDAFYLAEDMADDLSIILEYGNLTDTELLNVLKNLLNSHSYIYGSSVSFEFAYNAKNSLYAPYYYRTREGLKFLDLSKSYDYQNRDWYTVPKKLGIGSWSEPYYDKGGGEALMATYAKPCYKCINGKRTFIGVATADITVDWVVEYFKKLKLPIGRAFLISSNGTIITDRKHFCTVKDTVYSLAEKRNNDSLKKLWGKMVKGETGFVKYFSEPLKKQCYLQFVPFTIKGWSLNIIFTEEELFHDLNIVTTKLFIMGLAGYFLALVFIVMLTYRTTIPLRRLVHVTKKIGKGDFYTKIPMVSSTDEIGILSRSFCSMQEDLIKYVSNLNETIAAKGKIEKELSIASEIQQSLLPHKFPSMKQIDLYATLTPAKEVGGDLYDFFFIDEKHLCFAIGDVSGKGVPAALFMAIARTLLRAKISLSMDPAKILNVMNEDLFRENETCMFVTFFLGILNIETGLLEYCNAGHTPPLIHTADKGFYYFNTEGAHPPLGLMADVSYVGNRLKLLPEDIFFLYTDGVTEAMNIDYVQFSEEKLLDLLIQNKNETVVNIVNNVKTAVEQHVSGAVQSDDIAMLILKYNG